ncbi:lipase 1-like isoform X2 [Harmonia axyridis]|nr:lipase 1-like isoform X2 [Harmonia axyridis]XP_045468568.1 lipase 1-like isoform X2 [Harmonia axyridis]
MPVLFIHGLTACAGSFFGKKNESTPIIVANHGYDVWLMNNRGTIESSNHTRLNQTDKEFWYFSWQEIGLYDLPLAIDEVLKHNVHDKLILIGHSEGSTVIFVTLSELPQYNDKVSLSIHMGTSVYHKGCSTIKLLAVLCELLEPVMAELGESLEIFSFRALSQIREFLFVFCRYIIFKPACVEIAKNTLQSEYSQIKYVDDWSFFVRNTLCGGSLREGQHYMQVGLTGRFARYSFGPEKNLQVYNSTEPPLFHLENVRSPVVLWCGKNDVFCTPEDITKLVTQLKNVETTYFKGYTHFSHIDYLVAKDMDKYVYRQLLNLMKKYSFQNFRSGSV